MQMQVMLVVHTELKSTWCEYKCQSWKTTHSALGIKPSYRDRCT